jgi:hypothetical protein
LRNAAPALASTRWEEIMSNSKRTATLDATPRLSSRREALLAENAEHLGGLPKGSGQGNHYPSQRYMKFEDFLSVYRSAGGQLS